MRRGRAQGPSAGGRLERRTRNPDGRFIVSRGQLDEKPALDQSLIMVKVGHAVERSGGNAPLYTLTVEVLKFPLPRPLLHQGPQRLVVLAAKFAVFEPLIIGPRRMAHQLDQPQPLILLAAAEIDVAVAGADYVPRGDGFGRVARVALAGVGIVDKAR